MDELTYKSRLGKSDCVVMEFKLEVKVEEAEMDKYREERFIFRSQFYWA